MRTRDSWTRTGSFVALPLLALAWGTAAQVPDLDVRIAHLGERVREFYKHAQSVVCTEKVTLQPINTDLTPLGFARVLEYELRVEWDPAGSDRDVPEVQKIRELRRVNGRAPRPKDEPECTDPHVIENDPLALLLPQHRDEYTFSWNGVRRFKDRVMTMLDYRQRQAGSLEAKWNKDCLHLSVPVETKGRIWIDSLTGDVMRIDEWLASRYEYRLPRERVQGDRMYWEIRQLETSVRYRSVAFRDPEETLLLPESMETLTIIHGGQSYRKSQTFSNYRRFVTGARMIK
jgi:hypothetical protein